jgi:hypothetical protein
LQVITLNAPLTLPATYLPLPPPPQLLPLFSYLSLITALVNPAHGIQGCFNATSFDKNYWHFGFVINPFSLFFFSAASYPCIFHTRFLLCHNFYSSLINMPIIHIKEIKTSLLTLFGRVPGFMEEKGR